MSKAANTPKAKRNKNLCNSSPTGAHKVFIKQKDDLNRIGWSFLAIYPIISRNRSVCFIEPLDDWNKISVLNHPADLRSRIHIGTILLEEHCSCFYHIITTNCNTTAYSGENQAFLILSSDPTQTIPAVPANCLFFMICSLASFMISTVY